MRTAGCVITALALLLPAMAAPARAAEEGKLSVLILGDSLALCGFGKRLDERFREDPRVGSTFTYMACATNPLSWLREKPFTNVQTRCGLWTITPAEGNEPREMRDTYGTRGGRPKAHPVPKLDELLATAQPDILVMQTGSNLFGLFPGGKNVQPAKQGPALRAYLLPFVANAVRPPSRLRKIYWVNPPVSGRVAPEVQEFMFQRVKTELNPLVTVIDSRPLVSYPYRHMEPDREHFFGPDMDEWADKVYEIIQQDLSGQPVAAMPPLHEMAPAAAEPAAIPTPPQPPKEQELVVLQGKLVFKSAPMATRELLPYQESLVACVYDVRKVARGARYPEKQILVMHPAHIALQPQRIDKLRIGKSYKLRVKPLESTLWETAKTRDDSGRIDLQPYIRIEDIPKHPAAQPAQSTRPARRARPARLHRRR